MAFGVWFGAQGSGLAQILFSQSHDQQASLKLLKKSNQLKTTMIMITKNICKKTVITLMKNKPGTINNKR